MPFCYSPWTNIDISPQGKLSPCCKFRNEYYDETLNIKDNTIDEYQSNKTLIEIKKQFQQGEWPKGCERCRIEESNNVKSKRQLDYKRWENDYKNYNTDHDGFLTASIAFGNTCNLKCITCSPISSSRWQQEFQDLHNIQILPNHFYKNDFVDDFLKSTPNIIHIDVGGGEPFLSGVSQQLELLRRYIESGQSKSISLHYTTNGTVFPNDNWWELWDKFCNVEIQISIDGIGKRFEYIRFPATWESLVENIHQYQLKLQQLSNFKISLSHSVSAYNIYYIDEFFNWCKDMRLPKPWLGRVHNPEALRPGVWPADVRQQLIQHLKSSQHLDVRIWAELIRNSDDSEYFDNFKSYVKMHDQYRGLNFKNTFPEMAEFL
jgi:radical SAM protein with 4Fe4S-binding SPASM domain